MLEDCDLWLRMTASGATFVHHAATLAVCRLRAGSRNDDYSAMLATHRAILDELGTWALSTAAEDHRGRSIGRVEVLQKELELQRRLRADEYSGVRRLFWQTRARSTRQWRLVAHAAIVAVSPRALWLDH
jgi:hypothetical protein